MSSFPIRAKAEKLQRTTVNRKVLSFRQEKRVEGDLNEINRDYRLHKSKVSYQLRFSIYDLLVY